MTACCLSLECSFVVVVCYLSHLCGVVAGFLLPRDLKNDSLTFGSRFTLRQLDLQNTTGPKKRRKPSWNALSL
ncbi:hypothetical protein NDU88_011137 [Pleurodeles waltl]|uniref:Secreted protein n=1 Tax=Pleurodeles waltl TaxID=8319 RepID=A0AAV7S4J1_PLEWA|nr:hypothetical protein NDU88_011137 [Pleurodeles waltl]